MSKKKKKGQQASDSALSLAKEPVADKEGTPEIAWWSIPGPVLWIVIVALLNNFLFPKQNNSWAFFLLPLLISVFYVIAAIRKLGQSDFAGALMFWGAWLISLAGVGFCLNPFLPEVWGAPWWITTAAVPVLGLLVSLILRLTGFFQQFVPQAKKMEPMKGKEDNRPSGEPTADQSEVKQAHGLLQQVIVGLGGNHVSETVDRVVRTDELRGQASLLAESNRADDLELKKKELEHRMALERLEHATRTNQPADVLARLSAKAYGTEDPKPVEAPKPRARKVGASGFSGVDRIARRR